MVGIAWAASYDRTAAAARELLPSGVVPWTLDESAFAAFEVSYQPVGIMTRGGVQTHRWLGGLSEREVREAFEEALA